MNKQIKTLVKYQKPNNIINVFPIFEEEKYIIEENRIILGSEKEIKDYLEGKIEDFELSDAPFGVGKDEYFVVYDGIFEKE